MLMPEARERWVFIPLHLLNFEKTTAVCKGKRFPQKFGAASREKAKEREMARVSYRRDLTLVLQFLAA